MLINFAIGVVTGLVQEFQFGMNWSAYSRYVGDIFGAPLAMEGLVAFFLESTFLGLWIFGWEHLKPRIHLATIYAVAIGTTMSAFFILAANSWIQHPVGYTVNHATGHAQMTSISAILTNSTLMYAFPHTIAAAALTAGMIVVGVSAWHLARGHDTQMFTSSIRIALPVVLVTALLTSATGHGQAQLMTEQQPMKMAAAEALYTSRSPRSILVVCGRSARGAPDAFLAGYQHSRRPCRCLRPTRSAAGSRESTLSTPIPSQVRARRLPPRVGVTYWAFRIMTGIGFAMIAVSGYGVWLMWRRRLTSSRRFLRVATWAIALPMLANAAGWIFTEMGRQPWVVQGLLLTRNAVSPSVSVWEVGMTLAGFTLLYGVLAVVDGWLMFRYAKDVPPPPSDEQAAAGTRQPAMAY